MTTAETQNRSLHRVPRHPHAWIWLALGLHLGVDNVFDQHYEDVVGFPAPGAIVRGGISASL